MLTIPQAKFYAKQSKVRRDTLLAHTPTRKLKYNHALNRIAESQGFKNWASFKADRPTREFYSTYIECPSVEDVEAIINETSGEKRRVFWDLDNAVGDKAPARNADESLIKLDNPQFNFCYQPEQPTAEAFDAFCEAVSELTNACVVIHDSNWLLGGHGHPLTHFYNLLTEQWLIKGNNLLIVYSDSQYPKQPTTVVRFLREYAQCWAWPGLGVSADKMDNFASVSFAFPKNTLAIESASLTGGVLSGHRDTMKRLSDTVFDLLEEGNTPIPSATCTAVKTLMAATIPSADDSDPSLHYVFDMDTTRVHAWSDYIFTLAVLNLAASKSDLEYQHMGALSNFNRAFFEALAIVDAKLSERILEYMSATDIQLKEELTLDFLRECSAKLHSAVGHEAVIKLIPDIAMAIIGVDAVNLEFSTKVNPRDTESMISATEEWGYKSR